MPKAERLSIGNNEQDPILFLDRWGNALLSNLSSQDKRRLMLFSSDPTLPITLNDEFVSLEPKLYRGINVSVQASIPQTLMGILKDTEDKVLAYHTGTWHLRDTRGDVVDEGLIFTDQDGAFFVETRSGGSDFSIEINYPRALSYRHKGVSFESDSREQIDLGDLEP